jgi:hypothetical protein
VQGSWVQEFRNQIQDSRFRGFDGFDKLNPRNSTLNPAEKTVDIDMKYC